MNHQTHLLQDLRLPSRYESLVAAVGEDVAQLLVAPQEQTLQLFRNSAYHIKARGRGLFLPLFAASGTGKTTLVTSIVAWLPKEYGPTARLSGGEVTAERLRQAAEALAQERQLPANDNRVIVLNVDDRESDPPSDKELSQIKSYLREKGVGARSLVVWPETSPHHAEKMARAYEERAGATPMEIPAEIDGPPRETWVGLAIETLKQVNDLSNLESLGVDPHAYDPAEYKTVGDYLDRISADFVQLLSELLESTRKPIQLIVTFVSESNKSGVLTELTGSARYGILDADRLLSATPNSTIGKWWKSRAGLLVQTIVRLDARAVFISPSLSVQVMRRFGPDEVSTILESSGFKSRPPSEITTYFDRSEFGRLLKGKDSPTAEMRGNPAYDAQSGFNRVASEFGLGAGRDKKLNQALGDYLTIGATDLGDVIVEKKRDYLPLIPDLTVDSEDIATCLELHWRTGDYLVSKNRSDIAQYILRKLRSYAVESGWVSD